MTDQNEMGAIRKVLRSEITWFISIGVGVVLFYQNVIIPINNIQISLIQVQVQIQEIKLAQADIPQIKQDHAVFKEQQIQQDNLINQIFEKIKSIK